MGTSRFTARPKFLVTPDAHDAGSAGSSKTAKIKARRPVTSQAPMPLIIEPQLATLVKVPPVGEQWVHEVKYDGYRMLCRIEGGKARMVSRSGKEWTEPFAAIARAATRLKVDTAWLDGEVVVVDKQGRSSFPALQNALNTAPTPGLKYYVFDLLYVNGIDLRTAPLLERKRLLQALLEDAPENILYSAHFATSGTAFLQNVCKLGLEGMISKRGDLPFQTGRGSAWQKIKCARRQEMVIGGWSDSGGSRNGFGALLLGVYGPDGRLTYCGKVGTGFNDQSLAALTTKLAGLAQKESAFHNPPRGAEARRSHWVKPVLVAEVAFTEWTSDGTLRHPSFQGLREDKAATDVVRERAADEAAEEVESPPAATDRVTRNEASPVATLPKLFRRKTSKDELPDLIGGVTLTNPNKVLYPEAGITKRDLALYYETISEWILPHLEGRPLTLVRCPNGWDKPCFYQKNADANRNPAIEQIAVRGSGGQTLQYMMTNSVTALVAVLQLGALELHPWGSRSPTLSCPDRLTFDLDPDEGLTWEPLKEAALVVKALLENIGLRSFLKTTGGKGLHVVVPVEPRVDWDTAKGFTRAVAELLERTFPDRFTSKLMKVSRSKKIFIDYLRNGEGATAVAAYSLRAKANAPVSLPIQWEELADDVRFDHFNVRNVPRRLAKLKADPWASLTTTLQCLDPSLMARVGFKPA